MELLNHDLAHEFPQYLDKMRDLKIHDPHFAELFRQYDADNHAIANFEKSGVPISDEGFEELKKRRLKTKDEIYQKLLKT